MCIIVAKHFPGVGWAGAKNRDRNYVPTLDFVITEDHGAERVMMHDQVTGYKEGLNSHGVSILNTSLDVYDDESEVEAGTAQTSPDGEIIAEALLADNPRDAAATLIQGQLGGCTMVFDRDTMYLIEASDQDGSQRFRYVIREISPDQTVARSNHGLWLEWAGYQRRPNNRSETESRISSEARLVQARAVVREAQQPQDLVNGMCKVYIQDPQLNIMRTSTEGKKMRTTSQQLCVPTERTLYCRPVSSNLQFDFWNLNRPQRQTWVELLSNRELWDSAGKPQPFERMRLKDVK